MLNEMRIRRRDAVHAAFLAWADHYKVTDHFAEHENAEMLDIVKQTASVMDESDDDDVTAGWVNIPVSFLPQWGDVAHGCDAWMLAIVVNHWINNRALDALSPGNPELSVGNWKYDNVWGVVDDMGIVFGDDIADVAPMVRIVDNILQIRFYLIDRKPQNAR